MQLLVSMLAAARQARIIEPTWIVQPLVNPQLQGIAALVGANFDMVQLSDIHDDTPAYWFYPNVNDLHYIVKVVEDEDVVDLEILIYSKLYPSISEYAPSRLDIIDQRVYSIHNTGPFVEHMTQSNKLFVEEVMLLLMHALKMAFKMSINGFEMKNRAIFGMRGSTYRITPVLVELAGIEAYDAELIQADNRKFKDILRRNILSVAHETIWNFDAFHPECVLAHQMQGALQEFAENLNFDGNNTKTHLRLFKERMEELMDTSLLKRDYLHHLKEAAALY